ncbi:tetrahydroberberine oxidase-like [Salvia miltiorrhiza]|uniref:tetrahydroberberine oxidase-like n=1 Tax=Salvia miltiorrhiza TaxID=226208 RepID=UPI0025AB75A5|nr:tetrahydroberberine oxidase-like [Salvia miltiorrhiza]
MKPPSISSLAFILVLIISCSWAASADDHDDFLECLTEEFQNYSTISNDVYTIANSSYTSILQFSIRNLRFGSASTPKPQVIITPEHESQIPPIIHCAKDNDLEVRTRSGGHDMEGLSYVSQVPFVIIDLINLSEITVDAENKTAWVEAGATIGSLNYRIAEKSPILGFPVGVCPTVGVGGHFSGGGYGPMLRKYGLAADNIIDARIINANGRILDRKSMGEDLFWAIRGGGGASFGVITAWKIQLVDVPETVTVFSVRRTSEQNATQLIHRWQDVAPKLDKDLFIGVILSRVNSSQEGRNATIQANFWSLFLGGVDRLLPMLQESYPELGVERQDCIEMSWIESVLYFSEAPVIPASQRQPLEVLLNRTQPNLVNLKVKSDYVQKPIPELGLQGIERLLYEAEIQSFVLMIPYGGRMSEISESETPFPHRAANLYKIASTVYWQGNEGGDSERYIGWSRRYYSYMAPYVSSSPREAYLNYRDVDIGVNKVVGETSYEEASIWGKAYYKDNFDRLVRVKTVVDPENFFKNEQSIPSSHSDKDD